MAASSVLTEEGLQTTVVVLAESERAASEIKRVLVSLGNMEAIKEPAGGSGFQITVTFRNFETRDHFLECCEIIGGVSVLNTT